MHDCCGRIESHLSQMIDNQQIQIIQHELLAYLRRGHLLLLRLILMARPTANVFVILRRCLLVVVHHYLNPFLYLSLTTFKNL